MHVAQDERSGDGVGLAYTATGDDDRDISADELGEALGGVEVDGFYIFAS